MEPWWVPSAVLLWIVNSVRNARQSSTANGVPTRNAAARHTKSTTSRPALRGSDALVRARLTMITAVGSATRAALYFVAAANPDQRPAIATRGGLAPRVAQTAAA